MNSYPAAQLLSEDWAKKGKTFKFIPGVEAYVHPNLDEWRKLKVESEEEKAAKKAAKKRGEEEDGVSDVDTNNALVVENEDATKQRYQNPVNRRHHLVLLPKNARGLKKIFELVSFGYIDGFYRFPRIDLREIKRIQGDQGDIIASTACIGGPLAYEVFGKVGDVEWDAMNADLLRDEFRAKQIINAIGNTYDQYVDALGLGNVYLELQFNRLPQQDLVNHAIIRYAKENGLTNQLIVTCDAHYPGPEMWLYREMYKKLGHMNYEEMDPSKLPKSKDDIKAELYPKNAEQLWSEYQATKGRCDLYADMDDLVCDAIERSYDVAHNVIGDVPADKTPKFPKAVIPEGKTAFQELVERAKRGLITKGHDKKPEYVSRLKEELLVMKELGIAEYFVTLARVLELARTKVLVGTCRGSGGGSLVVYCLGITDVDPVKYGLYFSRFLSVYRKGMPDVDIDIDDRDTVLDLLREEFGNTNVVPISNYNLLKLKSLTKDVCKFFGVSFEDANAATRTVEDDVRKATLKEGDDKNLFELKFDDAMKHSPSYRAFIEKLAEEHPAAVDAIKALYKEQRSLGRHAGGVLVVDDLRTKMPLITSGGEPQSPWVEGMAVKHLEKVGNFVKYDLLGLLTLRLIRRTVELILERKTGRTPSFDEIKAYYNAHLHPDVLDFDDPKVYEYVFHSGRWAGVFQFTQRPTQRFCAQCKPSNVTDLAAITSIWRPGPLAGKMHELYVDAKFNKPYDWGHPLLNETLADTYGLLIFQEQIMLLANKVAGYDLAKCDEVRRAILKRSLATGESAKKEARELEDSFVKGCVGNGVPESIARKLYANILAWGGYGFNKAHATGYAMISYQCAYLMTYFEEEWLCSYLESMSRSEDNKAKAFSEIRSLGYQIVPIDINHASFGWTILDGKRFMPSFLTCKDVGSAAVEEIVRERPYEKIQDVLWDEQGDWKHSKFNSKALAALIRIGAFQSLDCIGDDDEHLFDSYAHMYEVIINHLNDIKKHPVKEPLKGMNEFYKLSRELKGQIEPWDRRQLAEHSIKHFGSIDVMNLIDPTVLQVFQQKGISSIDEYDDAGIYWFCITKTTPKKTKNGKHYLLLEAQGPGGKTHKIYMWGWDGHRQFESYAVCFAELKQSDFGFGTQMSKLRELE
jgi:DNA polymerase-3 subunit alpha